MAAERKLRNANLSLDKLDDAVTSQTPNIECDVKEEMVINVKNLKSNTLYHPPLLFTNSHLNNSAFYFFFILYIRHDVKQEMDIKFNAIYP